MSLEEEKRLAAETAAERIEPGSRVGLGTGTTVAYLLDAIARRAIKARYWATSPQTMDAAVSLGITIEPFDALDELDLAIDGADQIAPDGWLVKGRGGAHLREKIVAASARTFVVIADSSKPVPALHAPVPLELHRFGLRATLRELGSVTVRDGAPSPDGGVLADYHGDVGDPSDLSTRLSSVPGVSAHGLFAPALVSDIVVATGKTVTRTILGGPR
ncbi:MAG: ribose 5-phosphate isomerase A [Acidimicrobiales bacterium]|jgi:ribose 5-phosphate isomerase A